MTDIPRFSKVARIRAAKLAGLERTLMDVAGQAALAAQLASQAEAAALAIAGHETRRIADERGTLLSGAFQIDALTAFKSARETARVNIATAETLAAQANAQYSVVEASRKELAQKVLRERSRKDCLDRHLTNLKRKRASRVEARLMEEFGERQSTEE